MLTAIIVAAGDSRRMGFDKLFATIAGRPVIAHTIHAFERAACVDEIIVVAREDRHAEINTIVREISKKFGRSFPVANIVRIPFAPAWIMSKLLQNTLPSMTQRVR
jgi:CTP:molybdopterin cytidylyltransferase MocA